MKPKRIMGILTDRLDTIQEQLEGKIEYLYTIQKAIDNITIPYKKKKFEKLFDKIMSSDLDTATELIHKFACTQGHQIGTISAEANIKATDWSK